MGFIDYIILAVIAVVMVAAGWFIYKSQKSGKKCIGCPDSGGCSGNCGSCNGSCGCKD